jgi:endothelin-converting enzyme
MLDFQRNAENTDIRYQITMKRIRNTMFVASLLVFGALGKHSHIPTSLIQRRGPTTGSAQEICMTEKCKDYAKFILESLAPNYTAIDPCTDFDKYSCDGWRNVHNYRADQASLSVTTNMSDVNQALLHSILEGNYTESPDVTGENKVYDLANFNKMKTAYTACKNEDAIKTYGVTPVRKILEEFQSVFPLAGPAVGSNASNMELTKTMSWLFKRNVDVVVSSGVSVSSPRYHWSHLI